MWGKNFPRVRSGGLQFARPSARTGPSARIPRGADSVPRKLALAAAALAALSSSAAAQAAPRPADSRAAAAKGAAALVASRPARLHAGRRDAFVQRPVISTRDRLEYVPYERTYKGLPV